MHSLVGGPPAAAGREWRGMAWHGVVLRLRVSPVRRFLLGCGLLLDGNQMDDETYVFRWEFLRMMSLHFSWSLLPRGSSEEIPKSPAVMGIWELNSPERPLDPKPQRAHHSLNK